LRRALRWAPAIGWSLLLLVLGQQEGAKLPAGGIWGLPGIDKAAHFVAYGVLGFLAAFADPQRGLRAGVLAAAAVGIVDEWGQRGVPGRFSDLWDLLADVAGAAAGAWLFARIRGRRRRPRAG
jgi:VanZ family protein